MKKNLSFKELIAVASMLFGMFFGAGNLIYPILVGQMSGRNIVVGAIGFLISAVGIPILAVTSLGTGRAEGLFDLGCKVGRGYSYFFTCALYLTIGPLFAIPRCATVPFEVGLKPLLGENGSSWVLPVYSVVFFAIVLFFSLRSGKILTTIGKVLNPVFLVCLSVIFVAVLIKPMGTIRTVVPAPDYESTALLSGFFKGYDTLDALAGLAFGIVVVNVIRNAGVKKSDDVGGNTIKSGIMAGLLMAVIYIAIIIVGAQSRGITDVSSNGGEAFAAVAKHYFGTPGMLILALIFALACLKTAIGLVTSCSQTFTEIFPKGPSYRIWAIIFSVVALLVANLGLNAITSYSAPILYFLYPLAITLILLCLASKLIKRRRWIYVSVTGFTLIAAVFDFVKYLPAAVFEPLHLQVLVDFANEYLPLYQLGLTWIGFAAVGLAVGLVISIFKKNPPKKEMV